MSKSYYRLRPADTKAFYLDEGFGVHGDGKHDDTLAIRSAIRKLYDTEGIGILFIPEGEYLISDTILIPKGVRLIGYGENRPKIILADNADGYSQPYPRDKGGSKYMLWFTSNLPAVDGGDFADANAGTFYSSLENIDIYIGEGNTNAVAVRSHVAQHSFIAHCDFHIGSGRAGIFDVGNQAEDLRFFGGQYGIISTQCSPGWPFVLLDSTFEGHSKAAITCSHVGFTAVRCSVKDTPTVLYVKDNDFEKYHFEDCLFENITDCAFSSDGELSPVNQQNALNIRCRNVPVFYHSRRTGDDLCADSGDYLAEEFHYGYVSPELGERSRLDVLLKTSALDKAEIPMTDIPALPNMSEWVSVKRFGARGDGRTDDTAAFKMAVENARVIYLPQGVYILSDTIKLKKDTVLVGLHCYSTQLKLMDDTPAYGAFGSPKPLLEIPEGGDCIVNGFGLDTGGANPVACGCLWRGSERSMLRDVKFIGGHGTMKISNDARAAGTAVYSSSGMSDADPLRDWDNQYPSLWIKGGGVFVDIWSASTYASAGLCIENTSVQGKIYCMSLEHHVRREAVFKNVRNWSVYGMQTEEEWVESRGCLPYEFENCCDMRFFNTFIYRVSRLRTPFPYSMLVNNCDNIEFYGLHCFSQSRYVFDDMIMDIAGGKHERNWELTRLSIKNSNTAKIIDGTPRLLYSGFLFADGAASDSKGNFYFTDTESKRIYKIDGKTLELSLLHESVAKPVSLICDTADNVIVIGEYTAPRGKDHPRQNKKMVVFAIGSDDCVSELPVCDTAPADANFVYCVTHRHTVNDFVRNAMNIPQEGYLAPDGVTFIPRHGGLMRARCLTSACAGDKIYAIDEYLGRTFGFTVAENGALVDPENLTEHGESCARAKDGEVYVCCGQVVVYSENGEESREIILPERPSTIAFGGENGAILFITARSGVYACKV